MTNQPAYFEKLSFKSYLLFFFKVSSYKKISNIFFIDSSILSKKFLVPLLNFLGKKTSQLDFKLLEIVDKNGELIRTRIPRKDLFVFQEKIIKSKAYKFLYSESWNQDSIIDYINKGLASNSIKDSDSVARMLYLVNVINFDMQRNTYQKSIFISKKRPWFDLFQEYADQHNIKIIEIRDSFFTIANLNKIIRNYPLFYKVIKTIYS